MAYSAHSCGDNGKVVSPVNTLRPRQNGRRFADDTFKRIFLNENVRIPIKISLKFVPKGPINNIPALVPIMAWRRSGNKPLSEPMMFSLLVSPCPSVRLSVRPSVRLSVCPSVDRIVSALYLQEYSSDPFHICTSYQATSEGVSRVMPISKFKNLKFWRFFF